LQPANNSFNSFRRFLSTGPALVTGFNQQQPVPLRIHELPRPAFLTALEWQHHKTLQVVASSEDLSSASPM